MGQQRQRNFKIRMFEGKGKIKIKLFLGGGEKGHFRGISVLYQSLFLAVEGS